MMLAASSAVPWHTSPQSAGSAPHGPIDKDTPRSPPPASGHVSVAGYTGGSSNPVGHLGCHLTLMRPTLIMFHRGRARL